MGGGAWPFLVGGVICLLNCVNERDLGLLNSYENLLIGEGADAGPSKGNLGRPLGSGSLMRS
jgi:hypothetical protein